MTTEITTTTTNHRKNPTMTNSYADEVAPEPYNNDRVPNTADTLLRCAAVHGLKCAAMSQMLSEAVFANPHDNLASSRYTHAMYRTISAFNEYILLEALQQADPAKADEVADWLVSTAEAGDSYQEFLWDWTDKAGIDAERVVNEAQASVAGSATRAGEA